MPISWINCSITDSVNGGAGLCQCGPRVDCVKPCWLSNDASPRSVRKRDRILHARLSRRLPRIPDVLASCTLGNRRLVLSALLHFLQSLTISEIVATFNFHQRMKVTPVGLVQKWHRFADLLYTWYEQLHQEGLDETKSYMPMKPVGGYLLTPFGCGVLRFPMSFTT
jgi:hypothetical protein